MDKKDKVKILVCCHKPDLVASESPYMPIHVGAENSKFALDMQRDNDGGDNISGKNSTYCELTGLYWAWKNLKGADIVGLCHYRRYFDFHGLSGMFMPSTVVKPDNFDSVDLSVPVSIVKQVENGAVVVPKRITFRYPLSCTYCCVHMSQDYRILKEVVKETKPARDYEAFIEVMEKNNKISPYNMMLMNAENFNSYCEWLFSILAEVEKRIDISNYNKYQKRVFGFMGERLLNVWVEAQRLKKIYVPVIKVSDVDDSLPKHLQVAYDIRNNTLNFIYNITARY